MTFTRLVRLAPASLILIAALAVAFSSCSRKKEQSKQETQSSPNVTIDTYNRVPDVPLKRLDGGVDRLSYYQDKLILVNFWATWDKESVRQVIELNEMVKEFQRTPYVVLGISIDKDGEAALTRFLTTTPITYPVFYNGDEVLPKFGGGRILPVTYIILQKQAIYEKVTGYQDRKYFESRIRDILSQKLY